MQLVLVGIEVVIVVNNDSGNTVVGNCSGYGQDECNLDRYCAECENSQVFYEKCL